MPEERKLVTILFADITGSTALGEELDPEDVRVLMGRYYEHARHVVDTHGGTLEKFIGDAVMAVFGLPHVHSDDAERAVAAALLLREAVAEDSVLQELTLRMGVNTGEVVATSDVSSGDFLVTGDAVNVTARLQQCAHPGEILASARSHAAVETAFHFGEAREVEIKGKREPLRAFPVHGVRPTRQVARPPFVGRTRELAQLSLLKSWALEEHRPQLVSIVAPAGTGKTRLLEEFQGSLDADEGWRVATGRCPPYGQALTFWPLRGLLEDLAGGTDRDRIVDAFLRGGYEASDAARLADQVLAPVGIEPATPTERESIFSAWRLLIETEARRAPCMIVFEDLHWASDSMLDLVEYVMHPRTQAPLLLIGISRPELLDRRPAWGSGGRENFATLVIKPLNEAQTAELVEHQGGALTLVARQQIAVRSGGNPFFATELVRSLTEHGISGDRRDVVALPDTVHAAVLARLDALSPVERNVMQAASVIGRSFRPATVAAISGNIGPIEIDAAVEQLVARDLMVPGDSDTCTFRHVLIRDVAYGTLSRAERIRMHGEVARWIETHAADRLAEFAELIALHYREAVMLSRRSTVPVALGFDPAKAVYFLEQAGEVASRAGGFTEARAHLENAIALAPEEEHARLYEVLGDCAALGDAGIDAFQRALDLWRRKGGQPPLVGARLLRKMLTIYLRWQSSVGVRPREEEIADMLEQANRLAQAAGDEDELWRVRVVDLFWSGWTGAGVPEEEAESGRTIALQAAGYFEQRQAWEDYSAALDAYSHLSRELGKYTESIEAILRRRRAPHLSSLEQGDIIGTLTWSYLDAGEYRKSVDAACQALDQVRPGEPVAHLAFATSVASLAACLGGQWQELHELKTALEQGWDQLQHIPQAFVVLRGYLAMLHVALAREDRAQAGAAYAVLERMVLPDWQVLAGRLFAAYREDDPRRLSLDSMSPHELSLLTSTRVAPHTIVPALMFLSDRGVPAGALLFDAAATIAQGQKIDPLIRCVGIARALIARDATELARAIENAEQHGLIPHAARMRIVLAQLTNDSAPLKRARPVLERLQDRQFLRRLEEVAAALRPGER